MKRIRNTSNAPAPIGPYNQAILVNGFLYISGQIAIDPSTNKFLDDGDIISQVHQVLKNHRAILNEAGMDFENVVKVSLFVTDISKFTIVNEVYAAYFTNDPPAREVIEVSGLPLDAQIEMSIIAVQDQ